MNYLEQQLLLQKINEINNSQYGQTFTGGGGSMIPPINPIVNNLATPEDPAKQNMLKALWAKIKGNEPLGGSLNMEGLKSGLGAIKNYQPVAGGPSLGGLGTAGLGIYEGVKGISNLSDLGKASGTGQDLSKDILAEALENPMEMSYLSADQKKLYNQVKRGRSSATSAEAGDVMSGIGRSIPKAALAGLAGFLMVGPVGGIAGGAGELINGGLSGAKDSVDNKNAQLQALYDSLNRSNLAYQSQRRPMNLSYAGLQSRYANQLY